MPEHDEESGHDAATGGNRVLPAPPRPVGGSDFAAPAPDPPYYDIESLEPLEVSPVWVWAGEIEPPPAIWWECGAPLRPDLGPPELDLGEGRVLVLDGDPGPEEDLPLYSAN